MPLTCENLFIMLDELGIATNTIDHTPVRTVEEARCLRVGLEGGHVKNLFLKDKKKRFWLVVTFEDAVIDLKQLAALLGAQKLSFAKAEELYELLGIAPGVVSPFAVINDANGVVQVVLDEGILEGTSLNFHPLRNDRTTNISIGDFLKFLHATKHVPHMVKCSAAPTKC